MTRLERALHWWAKEYDGAIPKQHYDALTEADYLEPVPEEKCYARLTEDGRAAMRRLGYREDWPDSAFWVPDVASGREE